MMNEAFTSKIVPALIGFMVGAGLGYLVADYYVEKIIDEAYEEVDNGPWGDETGITVLEEGDSENKDGKLAGKSVDYRRFVKTEDKEELSKLTEPYIMKVTDKTPMIITEENWNSKHPTYEKIQLFYYAGDRVYADINDEEVNVASDHLGSDAHEHFGELSNDPDILYIRNHAEMTDYEITKLDGSYAELVLHLSKEEANPKPPKTARRKKKKNEAPEDESDGGE